MSKDVLRECRASLDVGGYVISELDEVVGVDISAVVSAGFLRTMTDDVEW